MARRLAQIFVRFKSVRLIKRWLAPASAISLVAAFAMIALSPTMPGGGALTPAAFGANSKLPVATISASPTAITGGISSTLTWKTTGATRAFLNGAPVSKNGSKTVSPSTTTQYLLTASNSAGSTTASATVTVSGTTTTSIATPTPTTTPTTTATSTITLQNNGSDWGTRINAADAQLGSTCGTIDAEGGGLIATQIVIGSCHTLYFGTGTWTNQVNNTAILLHDNTVLSGAGPGNSIIRESIYSGTNMQAVFVVMPYATYLNGANQANNITVKNLQFSGVGLTLPANGSQATVMSGLLNSGSFTNLWFNGTHAIGLQIGGANQSPTVVCQNITVSGNQFTNVGGWSPGSAGGGVSMAVTTGNYVTVTGNTFTDARGLVMLDLEPNTQYDMITNIVISSNTFSQAGATGVYEPWAYGIAVHGSGGYGTAPMGPITIQNNTVQGGYVCCQNYQFGAGATGYGQSNGLSWGIYLGYGGASHDITVANNTIKYSNNSPIILDGGTYNTTVTSNTAVMPGYNIVVIGHNNTLQSNYVATVSSQGEYFYGIEEMNSGISWKFSGSNYNTFSNNQTVGVGVIGGSGGSGTWTFNPSTNPTCSGCVPGYVIGPNSTASGNTQVPRPSFP